MTFTELGDGRLNDAEFNLLFPCNKYFNTTCNFFKQIDKILNIWEELLTTLINCMSF